MQHKVFSLFLFDEKRKYKTIFFLIFILTKLKMGLGGQCCNIMQKASRLFLTDGEKCNGRLTGNFL